MMHQTDERFILASKENLAQTMESFSLKVIRFFPLIMLLRNTMRNFVIFSISCLQLVAYFFSCSINVSHIKCVVRDLDQSLVVFFHLKFHLRGNISRYFFAPFFCAESDVSCLSTWQIDDYAILSYVYYNSKFPISI